MDLRPKDSHALKSPEHCFSAVIMRIPRRTMITFAAAFLFSFLVHGFMFANKLPNHDDVNHLFGSDYGAASGRWLLPILLRLDGDFSAPWVIGLISALFLSLSACLAAAVLRLRSPLSCVLLAAAMISFPAVGSAFTYMFSADAYFLSLLLACLAAYLAVKYRFGFIAGAVASALSLGIYQSYLGVTAALLLISLILELVDGTPSREALMCTIKYLLVLAAGLAVYFIIVRLTTRTDSLVDYMGIADMGKISLSGLPRQILNAYKSYLWFYISDTRGIHFGFMDFVFAILILASFILAVFVLRVKRLGGVRVLLIALLCILLPIAGALIYLMVPNAEVHQLMVYGLSVFLVFPLAIYELNIGQNPLNGTGNIRSLACWVIVGTLALTSYNYAIYTNEAYMKMSLSYEQASSYSTRLLGAIEGYEKYDENLTVVLVGKALVNVESKPTPELEEVNMTGAINAESIINSYSYGHFLRYYMGAPNIIHATESPLSKSLAQSPAVELLPLYPAEGSIAMVDEYIVVRFS